jgi:SAM-dependent methyltransferase
VQELDAENFVLAERFGMVLCLGGVLSHCLNYQKALQNIYNVLQEKGTAIFSVDSFYAAKFTAAFVDDPIELDMLLSQGISRQYFNVRPLYYCKYFRYQELKAALVQNKFKPVIIRSRPQVTGWDLHARFSGLEDFQKTLEKEIKLSERQELLDYGYQLEAVVTK